MLMEMTLYDESQLGIDWDKTFLGMVIIVFGHSGEFFTKDDSMSMPIMMMTSIFCSTIKHHI